MPQHLSTGECDALKNFEKKQIVVQKSGKGNSIVIVIVDRDKCIETIDDFLSNQCKFQSWILLPVKENTLIKFIKS